MKPVCAYYQAIIERKQCWLFVAFLRSFEHLAFDRTLDVPSSTFEFFVPTDNEAKFVAIMKYLETQGLVKNFIKLPNRLA